MRAGRLDGTDRVGEDPTVVVGRWVEDATGHEPRMSRGAVGLGVGGVPDRPGRALPAGIHHEMCVAGRRPQDALMRQAAAAAVADVLDDRRQRSVVAGGQMEPASDAGPAVTAERHIRGLDDRQARVDGLECRVERQGPRLGQRRRPEGVEVGRFGQVRAVDAKLVDRQVGLRHVSSPAGRCRAPRPRPLRPGRDAHGPRSVPAGAATGPSCCEGNGYDFTMRPPLASGSNGVGGRCMPRAPMPIGPTDPSRGDLWPLVDASLGARIAQGGGRPGAQRRDPPRAPTIRMEVRCDPHRNAPTGASRDSHDASDRLPRSE